MHQIIIKNNEESLNQYIGSIWRNTTTGSIFMLFKWNNGKEDRFDLINLATGSLFYGYNGIDKNLLYLTDLQLLTRKANITVNKV